MQKTSVLWLTTQGVSVDCCCNQWSAFSRVQCILQQCRSHCMHLVAGTGHDDCIKTSLSVSLCLTLLLQAQKAIDELSLFFFTNPTVSLRLIDDPHLKASYGALGVTLPSRTTLGGTLLDKQYTAALDKTLRASFRGVLDGEEDAADNDAYGLGTLPVLASSFALASDGWRKKACAQGVPLINLLAIPDQGPAVFLKVCTQRCNSRMSRLVVCCLAGWSICYVLSTCSCSTHQPPSVLLYLAEQHCLLERAESLKRR